MESATSRGRGWVVGQSILMGGVILVSAIWSYQWHREWTFVLGMTLLLAGGVLGVLGVIHLGRNRTAFPRPRAGSILVETGVYAYMRHPLYASVMLVSSGWALIWSSIPGLAVAVVLIGFLEAKARREELWLRERYEDYAPYARRVKKYIPYVY